MNAHTPSHFPTVPMKKSREFQVPGSASELNEQLTKNSRSYFDRPRNFHNRIPGKEPLLNVWALDCGFPIHLRTKEINPASPKGKKSSESGWDSSSVLSSMTNAARYKDLRDFFDRPSLSQDFSKQRYESRRRQRSQPVQRPWTLADRTMNNRDHLSQVFWDTGRAGGLQLDTHITNAKLLLRTPEFHSKSAVDDAHRQVHLAVDRKMESRRVRIARERLKKLVINLPD